MFDFIEVKTILTIGHLLGVVLGMGAAVMTDIMFMVSTRDKVLDDKELKFIGLGSAVVWMGVSLIVLTGLALFLLSPEEYMNSSKFLTKMTVVGVLVINGAFFHFKHLPFLRTVANQDLTQSDLFKKKSYGLFVSGAVSSVSWVSALILGSFRNIPYSYCVIVGIYFLILIVGVITSTLARKMFLSR